MCRRILLIICWAFSALFNVYGVTSSCLSTDKPYRDELATDLKDYKKVLKENGSWTPEIRQSLLKGLENFKKEYPELFKKVKK